MRGLQKGYSTVFIQICLLVENLQPFPIEEQGDYFLWLGIRENWILGSGRESSLVPHIFVVLVV